MAPNTYAPASLGFAIVFLTIAILPFFALVGFGIYKVRSWMASRRPVDVDVEAAISQIQTENLQGLYAATTVSSSTGTEPIQVASPESLLVVEPLKESAFDIEVKVVPQDTSAPAPSSSFELWANKLFITKDEFADEGCLLSSSYSLASTIDTVADSTSTHSTDTIQEDEPEIRVYESEEDEDVDDILSVDTESTCVGLVSSPSFMDLSAVLDDCNVAAQSPTIMITPPTPKIEWDEGNDNEAFKSLLVASPSFTALATAFDEEFDQEAIEEEDDGLDEATMRAMAALTTHGLEPIMEEQEPEEDTENAEPTRYTPLALLPSSRSATRQGTPQRNRDKENQPECSPRRSKTLSAFGSISSTPKAVPIIRLTPPTPPRKIDGDVSLESVYESDERFALDIVVGDDERFFF